LFALLPDIDRDERNDAEHAWSQHVRDWYTCRQREHDDAVQDEGEPAA
jgi:hypothetical protein